MNKMIVAIEPCVRNKTTYIGMINAMLETECHVVSYKDAKKRLYPLSSINSIYLNWIENKLDQTDKDFLNEAKQNGIKIVWVFHNKIPHSSKTVDKDIENIKFLMKIADKICILSNGSIQFLKEYDSDLDEKKVELLPHQDFVGMFGNLGKSRVKEMIGDADLVFSCFGRIAFYKNLEVMIKAFNKFNRNKKCKLLIAGRPVDHEYVACLEKLASNENIIFIPEYIPASMMGTYLEYSDILILPYDVRSSMNSSAMIMAFSYKRTVITSNISMASEFDKNLIYEYSYDSEEEHINQLQLQMEKVYSVGKYKLRENGEKIFNYLLSNNSKESIRKKLLSIVWNDKCDCSKENVLYNNMIGVIEEREIWKERYEIAQSQERLAKSGLSIAQLFLEDNIKSVALYGYGIYGKKIKNELEKEGIEISYIIDKRAKELEINVPLYTIDDILPQTDILIVTIPNVNYYKLFEKMNKKGKCEIYILKELF